MWGECLSLNHGSYGGKPQWTTAFLNTPGISSVQVLRGHFNAWMQILCTTFQEFIFRSLTVVHMDHQFCISDASFIPRLCRSNHQDTSTADPQQRWSSRAVDYTSWDSSEERARLTHAAMEDNLCLHRARDQTPAGRIKYFQASQRNILNKAE